MFVVYVLSSSCIIPLPIRLYVYLILITITHFFSSLLSLAFSPPPRLPRWLPITPLRFQVVQKYMFRFNINNLIF